MSNQGLDKLNEIAIKVGKIEQKQEAQAESISRLANSIDRLLDKLDKSDDVAKEALQRVKSAQHQIDDVKSGIKWLWRTVVGSILTGVIGGMIAIFWKGFGQ